MDTISHKKGKIYYSMGEVSEMFDVNPSLIRFWEQKFDILKPHKNKKGNRMFTPEDVDNLKLIYHLVKEKGMTLAGAQKRIKDNKEGAQRDMEVIDRLLAIKALLLEIRQELKVGGEELIREDEYEEPAIPGHQVAETTAEDASQEVEQTAATDIATDSASTVSAPASQQESTQEPIEEQLSHTEQMLFEVEQTSVPASTESSGARSEGQKPVAEESQADQATAQPEVPQKPRIYEQTLF